MERKKYDIADINILYEVYVPRKSIYQKVYTKLDMALKQSLKKKETNSILGINAGSSFSIIGQSGSGKTSLIKHCISEIGTDIMTMNTTYGQADILPFLYLNCPPDCSIKTLLINILSEIDKHLDTHYSDAFSLKFTTEQLFSMLLAAVKFIGVLILDECQNLAKFKAGNTLINYLTALANSGLSICISGTEELIPFLASDSSLSRRYQPVLVKPYEYDDEFNELVSELLSYEFFTVDSNEILYYWLFIHSAGLPSQLVELIYQTNLNKSFNTSSDILTISDFEEVFNNMVFKPLIPKTKTKTTKTYKPEINTGQPRETIDLQAILKDRSIDMLSVLKSNFEVIEF